MYQTLWNSINHQIKKSHASAAFLAVSIMYEVDARGLSCPEPVMLTQAALKSHGNDTVKVLVTEPHSKANVEKFARSQGKTVTVTETGDGFELIIQ